MKLFFSQYLNASDKVGKLDEGKEYPVIACLVDFDSSCKQRYRIKIRRCGQEIQYYLLPSDGTSAYCFGIQSFLFYLFIYFGKNEKGIYKKYE